MQKQSISNCSDESNKDFQEELGVVQDSVKTIHHLSAMDSQLLLTSVVNDFNQWKTARNGLEARWKECWDAYSCEPQQLYSVSDEDNLDRSRVVRPVLYEAVEAIHSNLMNVLFPAAERFFNVSGKTEADHQHANVIESFLRDKLTSLRFTEKYSGFLKQAIITGNSIAAVPWVKRTKTVRKRLPVQLLGVTFGTVIEHVNQVLFNGPEFDVLDMFDVVVDPNQTDFEKTKLIRRLKRSMDALRQQGGYVGLEDLNHLIQTQIEKDSRKNAKRRTFGIQDSEALTMPDEIELLEAWGDFYLDGQWYYNYVCTVANGTQVIRFEPNPYDHGLKPFIFTNFISVPNEIYGIGAIEKSLGLQNAINTLTNQKLDIINLSINSPFTYLINDDVFDPASMVTRPGALIPVKSHDTLRPIQYLNNFTVAFNEISDLKNEVQEATGAFKYYTGASAASDGRTATEVSALVSGGAQKFNSLISHLENTSLEPFINMVFENAKQFLEASETLRVIRENGTADFIEILPELIQQAQCVFKVDGSQGVIQQGQELKSMIQFVQLIQSVPGIESQMDLLPLIKKIYRRLGFKDEDQIFKPLSSP